MTQKIQVDTIFLDPTTLIFREIMEGIFWYLDKVKVDFPNYLFHKMETSTQEFLQILFPFGLNHKIFEYKIGV